MEKFIEVVLFLNNWYLYAINGELFYSSKISEDNWDTKERKTMVKHLSNILNFSFSEGCISENSLKDFLVNTYSEIDSKIIDFLSQ